MDRAAHLSVVVDLSPPQWLLSAQPGPSNPHPLSLRSFLSQLLAFLNSHIASKPENTLCVLGAFPGKSGILYSSTDHVSTSSEKGDPDAYLPFKVVDAAIIDHITNELDVLGEWEAQESTALVGALTKALCYINRIMNVSADNEPRSPSEPRILILSVSPDQSTSYIPIMNSIFSAQKLKVTMDVCQLYGPESVFLQQASHLTGGSYIHLEHRDALLQYLIMSFLPPPSIRRTLSVPTQDKIDFRAACFCHKNIVDVGFVCSVCLSIFCQPVPVCSTCRTKFPIKSLQRLKSSMPPLAGGPRAHAAGRTPGGTSSPTPAASPSANGTPTSKRSMADSLR
ncbi:transcription factor Tfb4 [Punctularia strigosozonata HHB-11173 SS5]|uniref:transcription factor Tfb4 n=1 Tax=Punctularia strigosozonata (strain HHB-11173) TaxID=741275 RepID=UPI0004416BDE|nr:transcription factor Tfb4 [Punctularia strigosozonata HHB-11173 SS5]EIN11961.1 transcription factor Tfb4 [Punctularia strigosozonata HHB-11173 SS5]